MMDFLVLNITNYIRYMTFRIRKSAIALLPGKWRSTKVLHLNPFAAFGLYILNKRRNRLMWMHANENMNVVRHTVNLKHFMAICLKNARYVFVTVLSNWHE